MAKVGLRYGHGFCHMQSLARFTDIFSFVVDEAWVLLMLRECWRGLQASWSQGQQSRQQVRKRWGGSCWDEIMWIGTVGKSVERLNERALEDYLGWQRTAAIYIVGGWECWDCLGFNKEEP
jgi:hypothetical protein